jgi:hypothetical protein
MPYTVVIHIKQTSEYVRFTQRSATDDFHPVATTPNVAEARRWTRAFYAAQFREKLLAREGRALNSKDVLTSYWPAYPLHHTSIEVREISAVGHVQPDPTGY